MRNIDNALPVGYEIVRGGGYFYFDGDGEYGMTSAWPTSSIAVYHLTSMSIDEWVAEFHRLAADYEVPEETDFSKGIRITT
jgi:hypothetical protein